MAINFERPEKIVDWKSAALSLTKIGLTAVKVTDPITAASAVVGIVPTMEQLKKTLSGQSQNTPETIAYSFFSLTLTDAVSQFIVRVRKDTPLQVSNLDAAVELFLERALSIPEGQQFDRLFIENPAAHRVYAHAREGIGELIAAITAWTTWDNKLWERNFDQCLKSATLRISASNHADFDGLINAISGPTGRSMRREAGWARHYQWINSRFAHDPVFSPDGTILSPLSDLYLRLRTYWHEEYQCQVDGEDREETRWKANTGDLHQVVDDWLADEDASCVKVIAGGPGSGKSSFAKALAHDHVLKGNHRVLFVELQRINLTTDIYADLVQYFERQNQPASERGSPGFAENPLEWIKEEREPVLIVFDGLDEITQDSEKAKEVARNFLLNVYRTLKDQNRDGVQIKAVILGRNLACQEGLKSAYLPLDTMLNVAPIRSLSEEDLDPAVEEYDRSERVDYPEMDDLWKRDQRLDYWEMWRKCRNLQSDEVPAAITASELSDLNVEPLLLHLLILSDFIGDRWKEAADNRNLVYQDILEKTHERNRKEEKEGKQIEASKDFFLLMECLGLAAWRGNMRTGKESVFNEIRELHARSLKRKYEDFKHIDLRSMVLQAHARKIEGEESGFEFIHKSFGEYLAARALVTAAEQSERNLNNEDVCLSESEVAERWVKLVGHSELTHELLRFVRDEVRCRVAGARAAQIKMAIEGILSWGNRHGLPVSSEFHGGFREQETIQRCVESALLIVGTSFALVARRHDPEAGYLTLGWSDDVWEPQRFLHRLQATTAKTVRFGLSCLALRNAHLPNVLLIDVRLEWADLRNAFLSEAYLSGAKLSGALLNGAHMNEAKLVNVDFTDADLRRADLTDAYMFSSCFVGANLSNVDLTSANLTLANLTGANLTGADLSLAKLNEAVLSGADLSDCSILFASLRLADFTDAIIPSDFFEVTFGVKSGYGKTILPKGFEYPEFWHDAPDVDEGGRELSLAYQAAYEKWKREIQMKDE